MASLPALLVWAKSLRYGTNPGPSCELLVALLDELLERNAGAPEVPLDRLKMVLFLSAEVQAELVAKLPRPSVEVVNAISGITGGGVTGVGI